MYQPSNSLCGAQTAVAKRVLAFDGLCGGLPGVAKMCNSFRQSLRRSNRGPKMSFDNLCGARTGGGELSTSVRQA